MTAPIPISLVTPSLNQGAFLAATIESVLSQRYPALSYSIRDGGSTDGTLAILESYRDRVPFVSEKDRGQADAINRGLAEATGEILGYLNSDDVLLPGALDAVAAAFADPAVRLVYGRARYVDAAGLDLGPYLTAPPERLSDFCPVAQPAAFWRRAVRDEVGPFDETLHHAFDYDYWLRIAARYGTAAILYLDAELAAARVHDDAKTVALWRRAFDETFRVVERRTGAVSLWLCVAKWDRALDGRDPVRHPHPVPWRAYPPAFAEFLARNPTRPDLWLAALRRSAGGFRKRVANLSGSPSSKIR